MELLLWIQLKRLIRKDNCLFKQDLFRKTIERYFIISFIIKFSNKKIYPFYCFIFFVLKIFSLRYQNSQGSILTFVGHENEKTSFNQIIKPVIEKKVFKIECSKLLRLNINLNNIQILPKLFRIFYFFSKKYELFVCLRLVEFLAIVFFIERKVHIQKIKSVISFTDGNPNGMALFLFAKKYKKKLFFISHGVPGSPVYPLECDYGYLLNKKSYEIYVLANSNIKRPLYHGFKDYHKKISKLEKNPVISGRHNEQ